MSSPPASREPRVVVAGIGNEYRRDDGVGPVVAARVARADPAVRDMGPAVDPLDLVGRWDDADLAVVIDALRSHRGDRPDSPGSPAGTVFVTELRADRLAAEAGRRAGGRHPTSSHGIDLPSALRLSTELGCPPTTVVLIGVVGADFGHGPGLSPAVDRAVPGATRTALGIIRETRACA